MHHDSKISKLSAVKFQTNPRNCWILPPKYLRCKLFSTFLLKTVLKPMQTAYTERKNKTLGRITKEDNPDHINFQPFYEQMFDCWFITWFYFERKIPDCFSVILAVQMSRDDDVMFCGILNRGKTHKKNRWGNRVFFLFQTIVRY